MMLKQEDRNFNLSLFETGSHYVSLAGLKLTVLPSLASTSQSTALKEHMTTLSGQQFQDLRWSKQ